jgi:nanoRNase/pAp phosphatase (c-di-AMP/oligoRNAs hydrolase)
MSKAADLHDLLADSEELTVVCHNNPDPDCLASALALGRIAAYAGIDERRILYSGEISHQQNRAFINLLEVDLTQFDSETVRDRAEDSLVAFVDHSIPGVNNEVPEDVPVDIVIDHHTAEGIEARFVDHREGLGATATKNSAHARPTLGFTSETFSTTSSRMSVALAATERWPVDRFRSGFSLT